MKRIFGSLLELISRKNIGVVAGGICFIVALLLVIFGFWKTLFVIAVTVGGYVFGVKVLANPDNLRRLMDKILPPGRFR